MQELNLIGVLSTGGSGRLPVIEPKTITANGTYNAPSGVDGFSPVVVNVPLPPNAYLLKSVANLPQPIASFNDGADAPMKLLKVAIEPQQDLHGYDSPWVGGAGKNKFDNSSFKFARGYLDSNGNWNGETTIYEYPTDGMSWWSSIIIDITKFKNDTITYSGFISSGGTYRGLIDENFKLLYNLGSSSVASGTINLANYPTAKYLSLAIMRDEYSVASAQLEIGSTATSYEPYSNICPISGLNKANVVVSPTTDAEDGATYTIQFKDGDNPLTVYGGTLDVVNGVLTLTHGYIASYNGETLPSTWISDRDVYEEGTTPTIGAEVCYKLATPLTIQLTPTVVKSLLGTNNIWADTGDITDAEYFSKEV